MSVELDSAKLQWVAMLALAAIAWFFMQGVVTKVDKHAELLSGLTADIREIKSLQSQMVQLSTQYHESVRVVQQEQMNRTKLFGDTGIQIAQLKAEYSILGTKIEALSGKLDIQNHRVNSISDRLIQFNNALTVRGKQGFALPELDMPLDVPN